MFYRPNLAPSYSPLRFALVSNVVIAPSKAAVMLLIVAPIVGFCVCSMLLFFVHCFAPFLVLQSS